MSPAIRESEYQPRYETEAPKKIEKKQEEKKEEELMEDVDNDEIEEQEPNK